MPFRWLGFSDGSEGKESSCSAGDLSSVSSVTQSCPTICDPMKCSTPALPVLHQLPEFTQTHVHRVSHVINVHPAISSSVVPFSSCPQFSPSSGSFPVSQLFAWGGQSIGVSALISVLPMNNQDWYPLEWTGWISLQSKRLSRVFSNTLFVVSIIKQNMHETCRMCANLNLNVALSFLHTLKKITY